MATKSTKAWYKSKSIWLGILTIAISTMTLLGVFVETGDFTIPAIIGLTIGVMQIIARALTEQPLTLK